MTLSPKLLRQVTAAVVAGLGLRLLFIWRFPVTDASDTRFYDELARNWLDHGVYGLYLAGRLTPVDMRAPGYPAFLAGVYAVFGRTQLRVMLAQAAVDVASCVLIAVLAAWLAPEASRRRVFVAALWLAALCPFTTNYCAVLLTEVPAIFLTALALCVILVPGAIVDLPERESGSRVMTASFLGGIATGLGALVRPETPLLLAAAGLVLIARCGRPRNWGKLIRSGALMGAGLLLALLPWAARNWITLREVRLLAPRYAELPGEYNPRGFDAWTATWLWRFRDVYLVPWKLNDEPIPIENVPAAAFDSPAERARTEELLERYNDITTLTPAIDDGFAELARERTARYPLRTCIKIPVLRAGAMWFTPRIELTPFSGHIWPLEESWEDDPVDFSVTLGFGVLNFAYAGLALAGAWMARRHPATAFLVVFVVVRTAFMTQAETPEPRYVLECFPAVLALAAQIWARAPADSAS